MTTLAVKASDLFDNLSPEEQQPQRRNLELAPSTIRDLVHGFERVEAAKPLSDEDKRALVRESLPQTYTQKDIQAFLHILRGYEDKTGVEKRRHTDALGYFLGGLVDYIDQQEITLDTRHLSLLPSHLALHTPKKLTILGDVEDFLGHMMSDGEIMVHGKAGTCAGNYMKGGKVTVKKDCDYNFGQNMKGGELIAEANVGDNAAIGMSGGRLEILGDAIGLGCSVTGGEIYLHGKYDLGLNIPGGNIFHKGTQVVKDGKLV